MGNALPTYSENGYGYAVEKAPSTKGWSYPVFEELWNYGFPQEMAHFARCVRGKEDPKATGEDGLAVMKVLYAAYASAGEGRKIPDAFLREGRAEAHRSVVPGPAVPATCRAQVSIARWQSDQTRLLCFSVDLRRQQGRTGSDQHEVFNPLSLTRVRLRSVWPDKLLLLRGDDWE